MRKSDSLGGHFLFFKLGNFEQQLKKVSGNVPNYPSNLKLPSSTVIIKELKSSENKI